MDRIHVRVSAMVVTLMAGWIALSTSELTADLVAISDSTPTGTSNRANRNDFLGLLDGIAPTQIGGQNVTLTNVPESESFQLGDIVGRDIDASGGSRTWEYLLSLPTDVVPGTGLADILFQGHAFERNNNNLEGTDELTWELFLNGSATPVDSGGPGAGVDFTSFDETLSHTGGPTITEARVILTVTNFNGGGEWFASRGILSANYNAVPESPATCMLALGLCGFVLLKPLRLA